VAGLYAASNTWVAVLPAVLNALLVAGFNPNNDKAAVYKASVEGLFNPNSSYFIANSGLALTCWSVKFIADGEPIAANAFDINEYCPDNLSLS
jgi:hypothetical protein